MNFKLIARFNGRRTVIPIRSAAAVVGRAHGNAVRVPSAEVSRRHCRFLWKDGVVTLEDMDSVNGTFLNGNRIKRAELVQPGDEVEIGPVKFTVEYDPPTEARNRAAVPSTDLLEDLADGSAVEDIDSLDDLPELEEIKPAAKRGRKPEPEPADDLAPLEADFDFEATPWKLPDGGDLRDLLEQPEEPAPKKKRRAD